MLNENKYLKYKIKYIQLKNIIGGNNNLNFIKKKIAFHNYFTHSCNATEKEKCNKFACEWTSNLGFFGKCSSKLTIKDLVDIIPILVDSKTDILTDVLGRDILVSIINIINIIDNNNKIISWKELKDQKLFIDNKKKITSYIENLKKNKFYENIKEEKLDNITSIREYIQTLLYDMKESKSNNVNSFRSRLLLLSLLLLFTNTLVSSNNLTSTNQSMVKIDNDITSFPNLASLESFINNIQNESQIKENLCDYNIAGENICADNLDIRRLDMPQFEATIDQLKEGSIGWKKAKQMGISGKNKISFRDDFIEFLENKNIKTEPRTVKSSQLRSSQNEMITKTIGKIITKFEDKSLDPNSNRLFITEDMRIIDGHHGGFARKLYDAKKGGDENMNVTVILGDPKKIIEIGNQFIQLYGILPLTGV